MFGFQSEVANLKKWQNNVLSRRFGKYSFIYFTAAPSDNLLKLRHNFDLNEVTVLQHKLKEQFPNVFYVKAKEKSYQFEVKEVYKASM